LIAKSVCEQVLSRALRGGGTFAELFYEDTESFGMTLRSGKIENAAISHPRGAGVRIYDGLRSIYVYTCDVTLAGLLRAAERAAAAVVDTRGSGRDVVLHERHFGNIHPVKTAVLSVEAKRRNFITVSGEHFRYVFDKNTGSLHTAVYNNQQLITRPVHLNIWRAPTDNDRKIRRQWEGFFFDHAAPRAYGAKISQENNAVTLESVVSMNTPHLPSIVTGRMQWVIDGAGDIQFSCHMEKNPHAPTLPRLGLRFFLPRSFDTLTYFGYGPYESYIDKRQASVKDVYLSTVQQQHEPYIKPQENGSHYGCNWMQLASASASLLAHGEGFSFSVSPYTQEELTEKKHEFELQPCGDTVLCLDAQNAGCGSASCGPTLAEQYRVTDVIDWAVTLSPRA